MCTAMTLKASNSEAVFGRTMDFSYPLEPSVYQIPKGYQWSNAFHTMLYQNRYSFIGIGQNIPEPAFADGVNEKGFTAMALFFRGMPLMIMNLTMQH